MSRIDIEKFTSLTGWTSNGTISAYRLNQFPAYIADRNQASVIFQVPSGNSGKYVKKTVSLDLTDYKEIIFHSWTRKQPVGNVNDSTTYKYKIDFGTGKEFYVPACSTFSHCVIDCSDFTTIDKIKITPLHNEEDYLIMSAMISVNEDIPLDILYAIKNDLTVEIFNTIGLGIQLGTVTARTGDESIQVTGPKKFLERYAVVIISDGINIETHQIEKTDESHFSFSSMYDGRKILNNFSGANLYLTIPVEYGANESEIILPGIDVWGITPETVYRGGAIEDILDTYKTDGSASIRQEGVIHKYEFLVDCEARHKEIIAIAAKVVRKWIAKKKLWINGIRWEIKPEGVPTEIEPIQAYELIPKIQYIFSLEYKEEIYNRVTMAKLLNTNDTYTIAR